MKTEDLMRLFLIAATLAAGAAIVPAAASETFGGASALDRVEASYVRHDRDHRHWEIQRNMEWRERHRYRHHGGHGYSRHHGGPPPWAPAHGRRYHERYERW